MTPSRIPTHFDMGRHPTSANRQPFPPATRTPRVLLTGRADRRSAVDGAWWPWTANLTTELHDLITAVTDRLGNVTRIAFDWNAISDRQRDIDEWDGITVTGPLPGQPTNLMYVFGDNGARMVLVVIPPTTVADGGYDIMRAVVNGTLAPSGAG